MNAGYTTNRCGYRWAGATMVTARLFQGSHNRLITYFDDFRKHGTTDLRTDRRKNSLIS